MASILYPMVLFMFCFGAFAGFVSSSGMYDLTLPVTGLVIGESEARNLQEGALQQPTSEFNWVEILRMFMAVIGEGLLAAFCVAPLLVAFGFPIPMAAIIGGPQAFVVIHGLWDYWLQRQPE